MDAVEMERLLEDTRKSLDLDRGENPQVRRVIEHPEGQLHAIVPDRAEKSQCIGPGGRLAAKIARQIGKDVAFHGADELALRRVRLEASKHRLHEIMTTSKFSDNNLFRWLEDLITLEIAFPVQSLHDYQPDNNKGLAAVAYSGGVDSSAALVILRDAEMESVAYTISPHPQVLAPPDISAIVEVCEKLDATCRIVEVPSMIGGIMEKSRQGRIHPCGDCHIALMAKVIEEAKADGHNIIVTGQSLPTGRQALQEQDGMLQIHLPALLSLTKYRMTDILKHRGFSPRRETFGCNFLRNLHNMGWGMVGPSVYRILRELEAGVLNSRQAWRFIKKVAKPSMKNRRQIQQ